jgi:hypothetical protein
MQELLRQLSTVQARAFTLLVNPTSNLRLALMLYGMIALLMLIVVVGVLFVMLGVPDESPTAKQAGSGRTGQKRAPKPKKPRGSRKKLVIEVVGFSVLVLAAAWVVAGYSTSDPTVCAGCHTVAATHVKVPGAVDPHAKVSCISCHEGGGAFNRYVLGVPARLIHVFDEGVGVRVGADYGAVTVKSCSACHVDALKGVVTDKTRGLKVSHSEPLAASATCLDCHSLSGGMVAGYNAGMDPCLRCHDSKKASAACTVCHDQSVATAVRSRTATFSAEQISEIKCGGCHDEKKSCDGCHGVRMPHSREFMAYAHARAGAVDFWYNGGKTCGKCHTATRRPCQGCHTKMLGVAHGNPSGLQDSHKKASSMGCSGCHGTMKYSADRDFCRDLCHTPAAKASSPR